jgi:hypothetical protein
LLLALPLVAEPPVVLLVLLAFPVVAVWLEVFVTFTLVLLVVLPEQLFGGVTAATLSVFGDNETVLLLSNA